MLSYLSYNIGPLCLRFLFTLNSPIFLIISSVSLISSGNARIPSSNLLFSDNFSYFTRYLEGQPLFFLFTQSHHTSNLSFWRPLNLFLFNFFYSDNLRDWLRPIVVDYVWRSNVFGGKKKPLLVWIEEFNDWIDLLTVIYLFSTHISTD